MVGVPVGVYTHFTSNLHIYDATGKQAQDVYNTHRPYQKRSKFVADKSCIFPEKSMRGFFTALVELYSREIKDYSCAYYTECSVDKIFNDYNVPTSGNTLYDYAQLLSYYISGKMGDRTTGFNVNEYHQELASCIRDSKFTNFIQPE
jgi:hypothetical protein